jgi:uncharacterized protein involved in exopolysaccharide biosynthesis
MVRLVLLRLLESYFRHRWVYLLPIVLMVAVSGAYYKTLTPTYVSSGVLHVQGESLLSSLNAVSSGTAPYWMTPADVTVGELRDLLRTDAFTRAIIAQTDLEENMSRGADAVKETIEEVRSAIWVDPIGSNQVQVSAAHERPHIAQQLVLAASEAQIQWTINSQLNESEVAQGFFAELIQVYGSDLEVARQELKAYYETHPEPIRGDRPQIEQIEINRLQSAIDLTSSRYASALDKDENARLVRSQIESDSRQTHYLLDAPKLPDKPHTSRKEVALYMGIIVMAGVALSVVGIIGGALLDRSFRFPIDVRHGLYLPILATVPSSKVPETAVEAVAGTGKQSVAEENNLGSIAA